MQQQDSLRKNTLGEDYVYDPREGRQVPTNQVLPSQGKTRLEQRCFYEGAIWFLSRLSAYTLDRRSPTGSLDRGRVEGEVIEFIKEEAAKHYPDFLPEGDPQKRPKLGY